MGLSTSEIGADGLEKGKHRMTEKHTRPLTLKVSCPVLFAFFAVFPSQICSASQSDQAEFLDEAQTNAEPAEFIETILTIETNAPSTVEIEGELVSSEAKTSHIISLPWLKFDAVVRAANRLNVDLYYSSQLGKEFIDIKIFLLPTEEELFRLADERIKRSPRYVGRVKFGAGLMITSLVVGGIGLVSLAVGGAADDDSARTFAGIMGGSFLGFCFSGMGFALGPVPHKRREAVVDELIDKYLAEQAEFQRSNPPDLRIGD